MKSVPIVSFAALLVIAALAGAQAPPAPAPAAPAPASRAKQPKADPAIAAHAEAVTALVASLQELAAWCEKVKLDKERAKVLDLILVFEPENKAAREALGFVTAKGGAWERAKTWKEPTNRDTEPLKDYKAKRAEVVGVFLDAMAKLIEEERRDIGPAIKARIIGDMSAIDALDPRTKGAAGEAQMGGKWVLKDAAEAPARRKQLQGITKAAIAAAGTPEADGAMGSEGTWDIKWTAIVTTENLRVMGTGTKEEINKVAVLCQAAGELFAKTFDVDVTHRTAFRTPIYLLADPTAKANFLRNNKSIKPEEREKIASLGGFNVDGGYAIQGAEVEGRLDCAVRMIIGSFMGRSFGLGTDQGALYEGVGIHLSWYLTGTRLTWTIGKRKYAQSGKDGLEEKLKGTGADWFAPGYELIGGKNRPPLRPLLMKMVNDLETEDMLAGFMLGVWLIDGRKDDAARFLRAAGRNELDKGMMEAFGLELNQVEERWGRWAKEARGAK
jgi:hypothetical protein